MSKPNIQSIHVTNLTGQLVSLADFSGKVLLIVNTASECGFTPQLKNLETLYQTYHKKGFEVLAFPSNDFGKQEPLNGESIQEFCKLQYQTTFPIFDKIKVKGKDAHPLYKFLSEKSLNGVTSMSPKWNFQKYLLNKNGEYVDYYLSITDPLNKKITNKIEELLKA
ncbi:MAG: glutathione peroxidase [Bacteroidetes bacterium B1(2017)]|nr:MAG: glutathione peroxidase [Bacteroidetes bacterium B1(2017)]